VARGPRLRGERVSELDRAVLKCPLRLEGGRVNGVAGADSSEAIESIACCKAAGAYPYAWPSDLRFARWLTCKCALVVEDVTNGPTLSRSARSQPPSRMCQRPQGAVTPARARPHFIPQSWPGTRHGTLSGNPSRWDRPDEIGPQSSVRWDNARASAAVDGLSPTL